MRPVTTYKTTILAGNPLLPFEGEGVDVPLGMSVGVAFPVEFRAVRVPARYDDWLNEADWPARVVLTSSPLSVSVRLQKARDTGMVEALYTESMWAH